MSLEPWLWIADSASSQVLWSRTVTWALFLECGYQTVSVCFWLWPFLTSPSLYCPQQSLLLPVHMFITFWSPIPHQNHLICPRLVTQHPLLDSPHPLTQAPVPLCSSTASDFIFALSFVFDSPSELHFPESSAHQLPVPPPEFLKINLLTNCSVVISSLWTGRGMNLTKFVGANPRISMLLC